MKDQRIVEVQSGPPPTDAVHLGDVAILPGLVNAHTHLEFSDLTQPVGQPGISLANWIGEVISARTAAPERNKHDAILAGVTESLESGTRLIGDIATTPTDYPPSQIDVISFAEVLGLSAERSHERLAAAIDHNQANVNGGWSPHAPYSTLRSSIQTCVDQSAKTHRPLAMHVAESPDERELLVHGTGPLADSLRAIGVWQDSLFPWNDSPFVDLIQQLSAASRTLLVHCNDLRDNEIATLAQHENMSAVFCPRTHAFFGYERHPVAELIAAGVRVALGTDSRASNPDLNLWREAQWLMNHRPDISPADVLKMATLNGGDALGQRDVGRIEVGAAAGLGKVSTSAKTVENLYRDLATIGYTPLM